MDTAGQIAMSAAAGFLLSLTPAPLLPFAFKRDLASSQHHGAGWLALFLLNALPFALLPAAFVLGALSQGLIPAATFFAAMYWQFLPLSARR